MKNKLGFFSKFKTILAVVWVSFTFSLVCWWWIYALRGSDHTRIMEMTPDTISTMQKKHRMFFWEGLGLGVAVLLGGASLIVLSYKDQKRHEQLQIFFANFSHDIKTSISRLRLQSEVLQESNVANPLLGRLVQDIARLDLQLENSLWVSQFDQIKVLPEHLKLSELVGQVRTDWANLEIVLKNDFKLQVDRRLILSVMRNIFSNSVIHGNAQKMTISGQQFENELEISFTDDGQGCQQDVTKLGQKLLSGSSSKGNGIGLYLVDKIAARMGGQLKFKSEKQGFTVILKIPGSLV